MVDGVTELLKVRFERARQRDDPFELQKLVLEVAHQCEDAEWAECSCADLARHRDAHVRGNALAGFGHIARRAGTLSRPRVHRLIQIGLHAHHEYVREQAASAADDIETFLGWRFERPRA